MDRPARSYTGVVSRLRKARGSTPRRKLLLIDDDRAFLILAATILRDAGYLVLEAHDAMQGFMYAQYDPPDIILLDMQIPGGGGMSLLEKVRRVPRLAKVPIVVVTASTDAGLDEEVRAKGATSLLRKPVDRDQLLAFVQGVFEKTD